MLKSFFVATSFLCVASVSAQTAADTVSINKLTPVSVVATRATAKTPIAFTNIGKAEIESVNFGQDIPFLLSRTPSVVATSDAGAGIGYSSLRVRGTDPTRINVTVNGVPLNDAESSQLYWVNIGDFASNVQSVQLQRGVGTSTNGAGAFGATLDMNTDNVATKPYATLDLSGGSYYTNKETLRFGTGLLGRHFTFSGRLSHIGSHGYIDRASSRLYSYFFQGTYSNGGTLLKLLTFNGSEKTYMAWDYATKADMKLYGRRYNPCGSYTLPDGTPAYYHNQTDNYHQQHYQLLLSQRLAPMLNLSAALHYTKGVGYYEQYKSSQKLYKYLLEPSGATKSDLVRRKQMDNDFLGFVASLNFDNHRGLTANLGGGYNHYDGDHFGRVIWARDLDGAIPPHHRYYDNNARKSDGNVYLKVNYELLRGLNVFADAQYRHVGYHMRGSSQEFSSGVQLPLNLDRQYDFFNPKFGLVYTSPGFGAFYASYAVAHKEPVRNDFEDMLAESQAVAPKAEMLADVEVGYRYASRLFDAGVNFYFMDYDNQFVLTGAQDANGEMVARNIKDSYRTGLELQFALRPLKGFEWSANATVSRNRAKNMRLRVLDEAWNESSVGVGSTHLSFSPDFILNNVLSYEYRGFSVSAFTKYVGRQYMTNTNFRSYVDIDGHKVSAMLSDYCTTDLDLSYTFRKLRFAKAIKAGVTVYNLFSERYESNGSCGMYFRQGPHGVEAFGNYDFWAWSTYSAQAPINFLAHVSFQF